jgi:hypothetical protein
MKNDPKYINGRRVGFERADGKIALEKCPKCGLSNYAFMVLQGVCTWCKFDANIDTKNKPNKLNNENNKTIN